MKILHYIPTYAPAWCWGGPVTSTAALCEGLAGAGHDVRVLTTDAGLDASYRDREDMRGGVHVHYHPTNPGPGISSRALEAAAESAVAHCDILHVTGVWQHTSAAAYRAARRLGRPYVVSPRGALGRYSWRQKTLKKVAYWIWRERRHVRGGAGLHFTSSLEAQEGAGLVRDRPFCVVPNAVLTEEWRRDEAAAARFRQELGMPAAQPLLINVGRLHHKKGLDLLPSALAPLRDQPWTLAFVGGDDDGSGAALAAAFRVAGLGDRVLFLPARPREELPGIYTAARAFLLPSRHENFGNVVVEALAAGCPVLISDQVGNAPDVIASGGARVLPRDAQAWTKGIADVLAGPSDLPKPDALAAWAQSRYSRHRLALQMAEFYRSLLLPPVHHAKKTAL